MEASLIRVPVKIYHSLLRNERKYVARILYVEKRYHETAKNEKKYVKKNENLRYDVRSLSDDGTPFKTPH